MRIGNTITPQQLNLMIAKNYLKGMLDNIEDTGSLPVKVGGSYETRYFTSNAYSAKYSNAERKIASLAGSKIRIHV